VSFAKFEDPIFQIILGAVNNASEASEYHATFLLATGNGSSSLQEIFVSSCMHFEQKRMPGDIVRTVYVKPGVISKYVSSCLLLFKTS
jgi:hypothetical protein